MVCKTDYTVRTNSMPPSIEALNDIPVAYQNGATVFARKLAMSCDQEAYLDPCHRREGDLGEP
jgi:hypothetical protein